ncbi:MAG: hypothetical protein KAQ72_01675 [Desulfobacula sp.]|nr:hypothetical protein [Desulfobacula sp.]
MAKSKVGNKGKSVETFNPCFALKSQNEIYYQMASILKEAARDKNNIEEEIFSKLLTDSQPNIFMENSL